MFFTLTCIKNDGIRLFPVMYASTSKLQVERYYANSFDGTKQLFIGFVSAKVVNPKFDPQSGKKVWYVCDECMYKEIQGSGCNVSNAVGILYSHLGKGPNDSDWHETLCKALQVAQAEKTTL